MYHIHILHGETELETINARLVSSCCSGDAISIGAVCAAELTVKVSGSLALTDEIITAAVQQDGESPPTTPPIMRWAGSIRPLAAPPQPLRCWGTSVPRPG